MHSPSPSSLATRRDRTSEIVRQIVFSRFLEGSIDAVAVAVDRAETLARQHLLLGGRRPIIRRVRPAAIDVGTVPPGAGVLVRMRKGRPWLIFSKHCAHEYEIDSVRLAAWRSRADRGSAVVALSAVRTLSLATARTHLTRSVCEVLARVQRRYLATCDEAALVPLTARELARRVGAAGGDLADTSRLSRVLRATSIVLPDGSAHALRALCPSTRTVLTARVRSVLELERRLRATGRLRGAWNDGELARRVRGSGVKVSRRLISHCRKRLGVPGARARARRGEYIWATADFSTPHPLDRRTVLRRAPSAPGVYELRVAPGQPEYESSCTGVIYIGRTQDLRVRLLTHAAAPARNEHLRRLVRKARILFRYWEVPRKDTRSAEVGLYRRFCDTYGGPPLCNRVSP